jgi:hypothetical protein
MTGFAARLRGGGEVSLMSFAMSGFPSGSVKTAECKSLRIILSFVGCFSVLAIAAMLAGCSSSMSAEETAALAKSPLVAGKARVTITRPSAVMYVGVPATITLDGQKVADVASGGSAVVDVPAGAHVLAAHAWSYPGEYSVRLKAIAGQTYALEVAPRGDSFAPSLFGVAGGLIDTGVNGNAGAFQMRMLEPAAANG